MTELARIGRERLPDRRPSATGSALWGEREIHVTVGFADDLRVLEIFARDSGKHDSDRDRTADDAAVCISLALQSGCTLSSLAKSTGRLPDGSPSSIIGAVLDAAITLEKET